MLFQTKKINFCLLALFVLPCVLLFNSCQTVDLYERVTSIPGQEWKSNFKPQFDFTIKDTQSRYNIFVVLRHNEKYEFNNLWISLSYQLKGQPAVTGQYELPLADNQRWLGTSMDDLYEHWIQIAKGIPLQSGDYTFTIGQIMRKDPLENVLNVGLRIEKTP
jgi:gliding motility-associated lipoprotein GldH